MPPCCSFWLVNYLIAIVSHAEKGVIVNALTGIVRLPAMTIRHLKMIDYGQTAVARSMDSCQLNKSYSVVKLPLSNNMNFTICIPESLVES
jgi:hypothetical protein